MQEPFLNSYWDFKLDPKNRVSLPSPYRDALRRLGDSEAVVLTVTTDRCLSGHPAACWPEIVRMSRRLMEQGVPGADFHRLFLALAQVVEPDPHGRILLSPRLVAFAGLEREVHFVGMGNRFEVWDARRFDVFQREIDLELLKGPFSELASSFPVEPSRPAEPLPAGS
ncbi:MAG: hypothetical protein RBU45_14540 [Myxococcota bacterium]|jgi:MraZ protein|nr:hypothetical protein [Myxococcota bacterium]